jgi:hypothetical protein
MWAGSASGFENAACSSSSDNLEFARASSSNGVVAAGAVADGLTGILALVKQLQGNLAGLESDMQQLHGVLHRPAGSNATDGNSSRSNSVLGQRKGSARSELLSECEASVSAAGSVVRGASSGVSKIQSRRSTEEEAVAAAAAAAWKEFGGKGCCSDSEPLSPVTPPVGAVTAAAAAAAAAHVIEAKQSWVGGSSTGVGAGRASVDVEAWVGSQVEAACRPQRQGSITVGGAPLSPAAAAAGASGGGGQVASYCIEQLGMDDMEEDSLVMSP